MKTANLIRAVGSIQLLLSLVLAGVAIYSLASAADMAALLSLVAESSGELLDPEQWRFHWRVASVTMLLVSSAAGFGGIGLLLLRRWGAALTAVASAGLMALEILATVARYARYEFEVVSIGEVAVLCFISLVATFAYVRWPHFQLQRGAA